ncbi:MAG TPA: cysteine--tRNA ligase [Verrucomicrobiae bacterium]|nr:cysteine--tRNA ligase [Verrucomicrobiae bacterium]
MLRLHDTLARGVRPVEPAEPGRLGLYSCGPTVYRSAHIGNLRTYLLADWIKRTARGAGLEVRHVKNITDVGHMRQELAERGGDKVIAAALAAGRTPQAIARAYEDEFHADEAALLIGPADVFPRATEHVPAMLDLVARLLARGLAYQAQGSVYFDTSAWPDYGRLSGNLAPAQLAAAAGEADPLKRHPGDFSLWRAAEPGRRLMVWESPYGPGFPGWHIECSAMAMAHLGETFDLHTGGVDNIFPHHEDERAQSEGATGRPFARAWVHGQHLLADGLKMAKSTGNVYTLAELRRRGYDPLAFRYLCATVHYRTPLHFTLATLAGAQRALQRLRAVVAAGRRDGAADRDPEPQVGARLRAEVQRLLEDDLGVPAALATCWRLVRHDPAGPPAKSLALLGVEPLLGLGLDQPASPPAPDSGWRRDRLARERARASGGWEAADRARVRLARGGVVPEDGPTGTRYRAATALDRRRGLISSPAEVEDGRERPDRVEVTVSLVCNGPAPDAVRCVESLLAHRGPRGVEIVALDNGADPDTGAALDRLAADHPAVLALHADHRLGEGAARNCTLRAATGRVVLLADTGLEAVGDCFTPLLAALADPEVGAVGRFGVRSRDMREFTLSDAVTVDAVEGYCLGFARHRLLEIGLLDERYRFYRLLDFDWSMRLRAHGLENRRIPDLPVRMHLHRGWEETEPEERERLSRANFRRFYDRWHHRQDLLISATDPPPRSG